METIQPASFEEFAREARGEADAIPIVRTCVTDLQTPVDAFECIADQAQYAFLFESLEGGESVARHSFIGMNPEAIVRGRGNYTIVEKAGIKEVYETAAPKFIQEQFRRRKLSRREGLPPLAGGAVGYLGFEASHWFEPAFTRTSRIQGNEEDDALLMFFRTVIAFDRISHEIKVSSVVFLEEAGSDPARLKELYVNAVKETARYEEMLAGARGMEIDQRKGERRSNHYTRGSSLQTPNSVSFQNRSELKSNWTREGFKGAVKAVKEHIEAGDCYQVVISQCFTTKVKTNPLSIYRALRATNPSPYMFFLRLGQETILGASPEMLVRIRGKNLEYRPIAGTRPRALDKDEDKRLGDELRTDQKEVAEHVMLVDLGRNDLGRVAKYGSVQVDDLMRIERYSHVQHLVSSLRAQLRDGLDCFDALASCFPAGTVTGAPKVRAMELIRELEPSPRGVYSGAIVYADYAGNLDSCIAIRTLALDADGNALVQAGAGIVAESIPECEYEETVNKARALFRAIEMAEESNSLNLVYK